MSGYRDVDPYKGLVLRLKDGEAPEREEFRRLVGEVRGYILSDLSLSLDDANDLVSETFVRALKGIDRFRWDSTFYTWLCAIARRTNRDQLRRASARERTILHCLPEPTSPKDPTTEALHHLVAQEAVASLDERERELVHLVFWKRKTIKECAIHFGITPEDAQSFYKRVIHKASLQCKEYYV